MALSDGGAAAEKADEAAPITGTELREGDGIFFSSEEEADKEDEEADDADDGMLLWARFCLIALVVVPAGE